VHTNQITTILQDIEQSGLVLSDNDKRHFENEQPVFLQATGIEKLKSWVIAAIRNCLNISKDHPLVVRLLSHLRVLNQMLSKALAEAG
jgi:hypothetical protein